MIKTVWQYFVAFSYLLTITDLFMPRRTKADAEATRNALLDAAEDLFLEQGVSKTSLEQIARHAGMTRGAVYWHFRDKTALFDAMQARAQLSFEALREDLKAAADGKDPVACLRVNFKRAFTLMQEPRVKRVHTILLFRNEFYDKASTRDGQVDTVTDCTQLITRAIEEAQRQGHHLYCTPSLLSRCIFSAINGLIDDWLRQPEAFDLVEKGEAMVDLLLDRLISD